MTIQRTAEEALQVGMTLAVIAAGAPDRPAIASAYGDRTFGELNARTNQLARALRTGGLQTGDAVSLICSNRPEFAEAMYATTRAGMRITPINWHLTADEIAYIVRDSESKAVIADVRFAAAAADALTDMPDVVVRLAAGGDPPSGFESYDAALAAESAEDIADPTLGSSMLYTSGTTGRPKGVWRPSIALQASSVQTMSTTTAAYEGGAHMHLCTGPLYHAAPLAFSLRLPIVAGVGTVLMDGWDAEETLRLIELHRITHTHLVPTMMHRLLALPEDVKARYDVSSMRWIVHAAAPCPVHVKAGIIAWFGPIVHEYYAATEGGGTWVTPEEWLAKPGTVGRPAPGQFLEIRGDDRVLLPPNEIGTVWIKAPEGNHFEYYKDADKTRSAYDGDFFTLGDMGYFDEDGYLFLTDRTTNLIISGGVNIYPAEVDAILLTHDAVGDVATIGVPNEDWGEEVKAVVELHDGLQPSDALARELIAFAREQLAHYKCPRTIDFVAHLPREENGKIYKRKLRDVYWAGRERKI